MKILMIIFGLILCLVSLWVGSYFFGIYSYQDWQRFPVFATSILCFSGGSALFFFALFEYKPDAK